MRVVLESEQPDDPGSLFRLNVNGLQVGESLTGAEAHLLIGLLLELTALPGKSRPATNPASDAFSRPIHQKTGLNTH